MDHNLNQLTDEELILAFQNNNVEAFDILVKRYKDPLTNFIYRFLGNFDDTADILQETFVRVYRKKHLYKTVAKFSTWIYTIAGNLSKSELRRRGRRDSFSIHRIDQKSEEYEYPLPDQNPLPDHLTDDAVKSIKIHQALLQIPEVFREAVILRDIQDLAYEEIAQITNMPIGTVKSRINRGRNQLQILLQEIYD